MPVIDVVQYINEQWLMTAQCFNIIKLTLQANSISWTYTQRRANGRNPPLQPLLNPTLYRHPTCWWNTVTHADQRHGDKTRSPYLRKRHYNSWLVNIYCSCLDKMLELRLMIMLTHSVNSEVWVWVHDITYLFVFIVYFIIIAWVNFSRISF